MLHTCCCRVLEKVRRRGGEEVHDGLLLERRRVRDVNDHRRSLKNLSQPFAGDGVDAGLWRCRHGLVPECPQVGYELRSDESGSADDDEFHDVHFYVSVTWPESEPVRLCPSP